MRGGLAYTISTAQQAVLIACLLPESQVLTSCKPFTLAYAQARSNSSAASMMAWCWCCMQRCLLCASRAAGYTSGR